MNSPRIGDIVVYLPHAQFLHEKNLATAMADLFGGFRSVTGAAEFATLRSMLATARKQG